VVADARRLIRGRDRADPVERHASGADLVAQPEPSGSRSSPITHHDAIARTWQLVDKNCQDG
jgi:hypothetical protein